MGINLDQFNAGLTTIDSIATSASAFHGVSSNSDSNVPSFDDHLQQAAQQSAGGNWADTNSSASPATSLNRNSPNESSSANNENGVDRQFTPHSNLTDQSRSDHPSGRTERSTERKNRHSKTADRDDDRTSSSTGPTHDQGSTSAASDAHDKSTGDASTANDDKNAGQVSAAQQPVQADSTADATQPDPKSMLVSGSPVLGQTVSTDGKSPTPAILEPPSASLSAGSTADADKARATQQSATAQIAAQSASTTVDATSTSLQAATQPGLAAQFTNKVEAQNITPSESTKAPAGIANGQPAATIATPVPPTPAINPTAINPTAINPTTGAALPDNLPSNDHSQSSPPSNNGPDATVAFAAPTAGIPAAIAAAMLGSTTVDTSSVDVTTPAVAAISKTTDVKTNKADVNSTTSQDSTSAASSTNGSALDTPRATIALGSQNSFGTEHGTSISSADQVRFVQRVAKAFEAAGNHDGPVVVRLSPPELGSLKLEISLRNGALTANVQTDNSATRNILLDNLPALRDRLEQQDIRIERFNVEVQDRSAGGQPQMPDQNPGSNDSARRYRAANTINVGANVEPAIQSGGLSLSGGGQLNVVI